jgi:hypothetical protein
MDKAYDVKENMLEGNTDLELILGKVQRQMRRLSINPLHAPTTRNGESLGTGRGICFGNPPNIRNTPNVEQAWRDQEIE